ncbi:PREDICTED: trypsin alpha-3-like [Rhagoletis zephyria]|uniref:trypsin alpha-3-like n=1 Tax=Rhagoletis zephyria TaxID=28612 RepID=UPI000811923E|nr:PREDICTED: trypsin alpha-3-like [Rhagoletis zephyria]
MLHLLILSLALLLAISDARITTTRLLALDGRIVGGEDADSKEFPYQVSLRQFGSHSCGGSILDTGNENTTGWYVVTAAHCVTPSSPQYHRVEYGITQLGGTSDKVVDVDRIFRHENYNPNTIDYDIALIKVATRITLSDLAQPIRIANATPQVGADAVVTGWGSVQEGGYLSRTLQKVAVKIVDRFECAGQYSQFNAVTERMLCAGVPEGGKDACQGDSGGPLVVGGELVGIVSWGVGCARPNLPGVYSDAAVLWRWIEEQLGK